MDWDSTLQRLRADGANLPAVARETKLSAMQLRRLVRGETRYPRLDTMQALAAYYAQQDAPREPEAA